MLRCVAKMLPIIIRRCIYRYWCQSGEMEISPTCSKHWQHRVTWENDHYLFQCDDKVALRNLSMVLRQLGTTQEERIRLIEESLEKAKAAVQLDIKDGTSWCES